MYFTNLYIGKLRNIDLYKKNISKGYFAHFILLLDGEATMEFWLLTFGWATIFIDPALSSIRAVRVFRQMYYTQLFNADEASLMSRLDVLDTIEKPLRDEQRWFNFTYACQLCLLYMDRLGSEVFSKKSRGNSNAIE